MPNCPHCLEEIKAGARKCPHCQTSLEPPAATGANTIYIVDNGLIKFAKFVGAILAVFVLVGVYLFGLEIKETSKKTSEAEIQVQKTLLEIERQKVSIEEKVRRIEAHEKEILSHRDDTLKLVAEVKLLVLDLRGKKEEAFKIISGLRLLDEKQAIVALSRREAKGIGADRGKLWTNGSILKFRFLDGEDNEKAIVRSAINQWAEQVNLTFKEIASGEAEIRISFKINGSSWAYLGTDALGIPQDQPTVNYGTLASVRNQNEAIQIALHEFGHVLGLQHEFQNPSAGTVFDQAAVRDYAKNSGLDDVTIEQNFLALGKDYPGARPYDAKSIMNYSFPRSLFLPGKETQPGQGLSDSDKSYTSSLYPRS